AYRPLRNRPRIASLITAIGLSLLLQYGGQIFLPANQAISDKVNVFSGSSTIVLKPGSGAKTDTATLQANLDKAEAAFKEKLKTEKGEFDLSPEGRTLRDARNEARNAVRNATNTADAGEISLVVPYGRAISMVITFVLMGVLTYLVLFTKPGRAMRAVSHDFDAAGLMGVNVDRIVTFTFVLGSTLAGAGAMMVATFYSGTKIDTFFGALLGIKAFVAAVLGGIGNIPGAVLGGLLMGVTESLVVWAGYDGYKDAVAFVVLIVVLMFRPGGLLGSNKVEKV
ncbi:branched-chain amino acid ABC transporter permease, partial [bacterium]